MKSINSELFRKRLREVMKNKGFTSNEKLAQKADVSTSTIEKWLYGKTNNITGEKEPYTPSLDTVYKVAQALDCSIDYFINPDMNCLTVSNQMMSDKTGLDDESLRLIIEMYKAPSPEHEQWLKTLNVIIHNPNILYVISEIISSKKISGVLEVSKTPDEEGLNSTNPILEFNDENEYKLFSYSANGSMLQHTIMDELLETAYWKELESLIDNLKEKGRDGDMNGKESSVPGKRNRQRDKVKRSKT